MQQKEIFRRVRYAVAWALLFLFIVCLLGKYAKQQRQQQQRQQKRRQPASWHCEWKLGKQSTFPTFVVDKHLRDMRAGNRVCNICLPGTGLPCHLPPPLLLLLPHIPCACHILIQEKCSTLLPLLRWIVVLDAAAALHQPKWNKDSERGEKQREIESREREGKGRRRGPSSISWPIMPTWGGHFRYT